MLWALQIVVLTFWIIPAGVVGLAALGALVCRRFRTWLLGHLI